MARIRGVLAGCALIVVAAEALTGCGGSGSIDSTQLVTSSVTVHGPVQATIEIPGQDRFAPFVTLVAADGSITITNKDADEHTATNLPGAAVKFDVHVKGGESQTLKLPAGVYRYYCTLHAKYSAATDQVAALPTAGFPDQPMEGLIIVG